MHNKATARHANWGDTPDSPKRSGMRIQRGRFSVFVPDEELFNLANDIADYLDGDTHTTYSSH